MIDFNRLTLRQKIDGLNAATREYDKGTPIMSDKEWDDLYFLILQQEKETGIVYPDSPSQEIHFETVSSLQKRKHNHLMLSLDKTKDDDELSYFLYTDDKDFIAMLKLDGLTVSLQYENGYLVGAETRGNGVEGEDVLNNVYQITNVPKQIPLKETLIVDGEVICFKNVFERINKDNKYKNPRNYAAGSLRLLNSKESASRCLSFVAWDVIQGMDDEFLSDRLDKLIAYGFSTVPYLRKDDSLSIEDYEVNLIRVAEMREMPIDGLVFKYNNQKDRAEAGRTEHHFKDAMAYKFYDEDHESTLRHIDWSIGRTGVITPVAIFDPIEIEDTTVQKASLHNINCMKKLYDKTWREGLTLSVIKANLIIPQITKVTDKGNLGTRTFDYITHCPACGEKLLSDDITLTCPNEDCISRLAHKIDYYCSKKGMDIKGLSEATISMLIDVGWLEKIKDIYYLKEHRKEWIFLDGFNQVSVDNLLTAIENSRETTLPCFLAALGVPLCGRTVMNKLCEYISSYEDLRKKIDDNYYFGVIPSFGDAMNQSLHSFNWSVADELYKELKILEKEENQEDILKNKAFAITGKLKRYKSRDDLVAEIRRKGGKATTTVSKNTNYLICNDKELVTSKLLEAKKLNIPIITEDEFISNFLVEK